MSADTKKILVVDDSPIVLDATRGMLETGGFAVVTLDSPFDLPSTLDHERPDLVLVDVAMPLLQGDAMVAITKRHKLYRCPIVLYSSRPAAELERLARSSGADGYICKTADAGSLLASVRQHLPAP